MEIWSIFILCTLCLSSFVVTAQSPFKKICPYQVEISFFDWKKSFEDARQSCVDYGGHLVKVDNAGVQQAIENALGLPDNNRYFIGGVRTDSHNFKWIADGKEVGATGYVNWKLGQPNNLGNRENCMAIGDHMQYQWTDVTCVGFASESRYICERDQIAFTSRTSRHDKNFTCQSAVSEVLVEWTRNSNQITTTDRTGVYQIKSSDRSVLMLENANMSDSGTYTCVGETACVTKQENVEVDVDGTPKIQNILNNRCNSSLLVIWKPNKAAVGFPHRISAIHDTNVTLFETPKNNDIHQTQITELVSSVDYTVQITPCLTNELCIDNSSAEMINKTMIITDPVSSVFLVNSDDGRCKASWWPPGRDKTFTLTINCSINKKRGIRGKDFTSTEVVERLKSTNHVFQPLPNRNCEISVQVQECGEISEAKKTTDICVTAAKEPAHLGPPVIFTSSSRLLMELVNPSEQNGLISCVFLIVCYGNCGHKNFTIEDLKTANKTVVENLNGDIYAIAIAIPMPRLLVPIGSLVPSAHYFELSNGNITRCNVYNTTALNSTNVANGNFHALNLIADNSTNVSAFLVTSTPSNGKVLLKSSPFVIIQNHTKVAVTVQNETKENETETSEPPSGSGLNAGLTVGVGLIGLVIGAVSLYAFMWLRQRRAKPMDKNSLERNTSDQARPTRTSVVQQEDQTLCNYENYPDTPAYEEITAGNKGSSTYESYNA